MGDITNSTPASTFGDLLQIQNSNNGIDGTLRTLEDGKGTDGPIALSTSTIQVITGKTLDVDGTADFAGTVTTAGNLEANNIFLGGTAAANELNDYEQNTFTPTIAFGGASVGVTYTTQLGYYTKIGRVVFINGRLTLSNKGSSTGQANMGGLPFTSLDSGNNTPPITLSVTSINLDTGAGMSTHVGRVLSNSTNMRFEEVGDNIARADLTDADFVNTSDVFFAGFYIV